MNDTRWLTLLRLKRRLGIENATLSEGDTARLEAALRAAQSDIEAATGRRYAPIVAAISHCASPGQRTLSLRDDLMSLTSVQDGDGTVFLPDNLSWDAGSVTRQDGQGFFGGDVRVTGMWCHHPAPDLAFRASSDALTGSISAAAATIDVVSASSADLWGDTPRFTSGQLICVDSELLRVTQVSGNTLSVRRGQNGTSAASHTAGAGIFVFVPGFAVEALGLRLAAWLYREADGEHGRDYPAGIARGIEKLRRERV